MAQAVANRPGRRVKWSMLLWAGSLSIGLLSFAGAWGLEQVLVRAEYYPMLALQGSVYDRGMTQYATGGRHPQPPVAVVQITEYTRLRLKKVPNFVTGKGELRFRRQERAFHGKVLKKLKRLGAKVVVFDMVFDEEEPAAIDNYFAQAIREHGGVVLAAADDAGVEKDGRVERTHSLQPPTEQLRAASAGMGAANLPLDTDKTIRRFAWWSIGMDQDTAEDTEIPSLGIAAAAVYKKLDPAKVIQTEVKPKGTFLGMPIWSPSNRNDSFYPSYIRYFGPKGSPAGPGSVVDYEQVFAVGDDPAIDEEALRKQIEGKIVLIGDSTAAGQDLHRSPVLTRTKNIDSSQEMPGVEIQAQVVQTALSGLYPKEAAPQLLVLILFSVCMLMAVVTRRLTPLPAVGVAIALALILVVGSTRLLATGGIWLEPITALTGLVFSTVTGTAFMFATEHRERMAVRRQLVRHVGHGVASKLEDHEWPDLGGESVEITLLFSDLQGFTSLSETMTSRELCALLNRYFGDVIFPLVDKHGGSTDKLMGDGMMAYFGWPARHPDHAARAIRCALEIQEELSKWLRLPENAGLPTLRTRIGIHTGEATVGEIGSGSRAEFTVIGDVVNVASRLEGMNKEFGTRVLLSEATRVSAGEMVPLTNRGIVAVRGRAEPIPVYSVDLDEGNGTPGDGRESAAAPPVDRELVPASGEKEA